MIWEQLIPEHRPRYQPPARREATGQQRASKPKALAVGDTVGEWTLLAFEPGQSIPVRVVARWVCQCSCGKVKTVSANALTAANRGRTGEGSAASRSCGHARRKEQ